MSSEFLKHRQTLNRYPTDFLLGDLLVRAGIIRQSALDEAIKLAGNKQMQVGQMLIMARHLTPAQLQIAVDAQSALRDRRIDMNAACRGIKFACKSGLGFSEAVNSQEVTASKLSPTNKLGELLLAAGLITPDEFAKALQRSQSTGLPLGRILVLNGSVSDTILTTALEIQVRIRDQMLTRAEAIDCLKAASTIGTTDETAEIANQVEAALKKPRRKGMRLGELFVLAGILAEADVMNALELGLVNDQPMGQILVNQGFITPELLEAALKVQELVDRDELTATLAVESLNKIHHTGVSLPEALNQQEDPQSAPAAGPIDFRELLSVARIAGEEEITSSFEIVLCNPPLLMQVLVLAGLLDERVSKSVLKCYTMMGEAYLSQEDAVVALDYCLQKYSEGAAPEFSFEDALLELGWTFTPDQIETVANTAMTQSEQSLYTAMEEAVVSESVEKVFDFSVDPLHLTAESIIAEAERAAEITGDQNLVVDSTLAKNINEQAEYEQVEPEPDPVTPPVKPASSAHAAPHVAAHVAMPVTPHLAAAKEYSKEPSAAEESPNKPIDSAVAVSIRKKSMSLKSLLSNPEEAALKDEAQTKAISDTVQDAPALRISTPIKSVAHQVNPVAPPVELHSLLKPKQGNASHHKLAALVGISTNEIPNGNLLDAEAESPTETDLKIGESYLRLAESYYEHGNFFEAEVLYIRVLNLREKAVGEYDSSLVGDLNNLANVLCQQGKFEAAEPHIKRAVHIMEQNGANGSIELAESLSSLAGIYFQQEKFAECEPLLQKSLLIRTQVLGEHHPAIADCLRDYAKLLRKTNRSDEAEKIYARAKKLLAVQRNTM